jgi:hypothetical protein
VAVPEFETIGPYADPEFVAEGGMAWVFRVQDPRFQTRRLALKVLKPDAARGDELRLFEREAELLAGISHPNLVTIFDYGRDEATGYFYYTMSFIEGPSLSELIRRQSDNRLPPEQAVKLVCGMLEGLEQLHDRGIVHRDIKPGNILVAPGERPVLMDLGIARVLPESDLTQYTSTQVIRGTPLYMSPEQSEGKAARATSDIFSVGLTLYCMLTGHTVYDDAANVDSTNPNSVRDYLGHLRFARGDFELHLTKDIPRALRQVVYRACRIDPEERFQNAREMMEALRTALSQAEGGVPRWAVAAGAALLLLAAGFGAYQFIVVPREQRQALEEAQASGKALADEVPALVEKVKDLSPPPPAELLDDADELMHKGQSYLVDAQDDALLGEEDGSYVSFATANFGKAEAHFDSACEKLAPEVTGRVDQESKHVEERVATLRDAGAETHVPDDWKEFEARIASLAPPAEGTPPCALLAAELARLDQSRELLVAAKGIEDALGETLRGVAETACSEARSAQTLAQGEAAEAPPYKAAVEAGNALLEQAQNFMFRKSYTAARKACREAGKRFAEAQLVVTASHGRDEARRVEREITAQGSEPAQDGTLKIAEGDEHYAAGEYEQAAQSYQASIELLKSGAAKSNAETKAHLALSSAQAARETAVDEGAEQSAPGPLARGDRSRDTASEALRSERYEEAQQAAALAERSYGEARAAAGEALKGASSKEYETQMKLAGQPCDELESSAARSECQSARNKLAGGRAMLQAKDAPGAIGQFNEALAALERAGIVEQKYLATKQWDPELVSRKPERQVVEERRNSTVGLEVEARDRNKDPLVYAWTFDGQPLESTGPHLDLLVERSGTAMVRVSDGHGGSLTESWEIHAKNTPPVVEVSPGGKTIALEPGQKARITAKTSDPDGDPVQTAFRLDGRPVGEGASYEFSSDKPGTYRLEVVGTDAAGARTVVARSIRVKAPPVVAAVPKPAPPAPPPPAAKPRPEPKPAPKPAPPPAKEGWRVALQRYEAALEDKNMKQLQSVWLLPQGSPYRMRWENKFSRNTPIDIDVHIRKVNEQGKDRVIVIFDQTESQGGRTRTYTYQAVLLKRETTDDWQIIDAKFVKG